MPIISIHRARANSTPAERGQALVELALVAPILVLILVAIFQFAYVLETQIGLTNALREAARRAAAAPGPTDTWVLLQLNGPSGTDGLLAQNVQNYQASRATEAVTFCSYTVAGVSGTNYRVDVGIAYDHPVFFPILSFVTGSPTIWRLTSTAEMRLENDLAVDPGACP